MPAELDKNEAERVRDKQTASETIKRIVERDFGGKCYIDWETDTLEIDVPDKHKMDCAMAIQEAMQRMNSDACDLEDEEAAFFIKDGDPNKPVM